jgi:hypothetical protein
MATKKTYFFEEEDNVSYEQLVAWLEAPVLLKHTYYPLVLGMHLRRIGASEVASKMDEWFVNADLATLKGYLKIELEQLLRPNYLEKYAEARTDGWWPVEPRRDAASYIGQLGLFEARATIHLAYATALRLAAKAPLELLDKHQTTQQQLIEKAVKIEAEVEEEAAEAVRNQEEAIYIFKKETKRWGFDSEQLVPNVRYALKWLKKRCKHLASLEQQLPIAQPAPDSEPPPLPNVPEVAGSEQQPVSRNPWAGLLLNGFTVDELDGLLVFAGVLADLNLKTPMPGIRPRHWCAAVAALRERGKLAPGEAPAIRAALLARYASCSNNLPSVRALQKEYASAKAEVRGVYEKVVSRLL